jgi:hypothetical protein
MANHPTFGTQCREAVQRRPESAWSLWPDRSGIGYLSPIAYETQMLVEVEMT